ncbi:MAG: nucleoside 2-deoxyribosyltransferase [Proteobacteria bacterium]|nr:nucleoside 2-deoxyribosyltransferase [Pseudomonadota bacterium]MBU1056804.1 nucleoside 2-deoxyribosyltransferase [Pseudomonadota bacterium]
MSQTARPGGLNIYFAGAIRGGRDDAELYATLIHCLKKYGTILTEHVGNNDLLKEEQFLSEEEIFARDMGWMTGADLVVAEVSTPSLGVGYELAVAERLKIPTVCLFRERKGCTLSAMIQGNPFFEVRNYGDRDEAERTITRLMEDFQKQLLF